MSDQSETPEHHGEIVIVRRKKSGHGEGHHGGVWKIAYADFMTAMMAFFLVMWLINASNEETRTQVASYFNPVRLIDMKPAERGLQTPDPAAKPKETQNEKPDKKKAEDSPPPESSASHTPAKDKGDAATAQKAIDFVEENKFFANPYKEIEKILAEYSRKKEEKSNLTADMIGQKIRSSKEQDPFGSSFWSQGKEQQEQTLPPQDSGKIQQETPLAQNKPPVTASPASVFSPQMTGKEPEKGTQLQENNSGAFATPLKERLFAQKQERLISDISNSVSALAKKFGANNLPSLEVKRMENGILISLTDQADFEMFPLSSARPSAQLIVMIDKISETLKKTSEKIIVRGHTDARPFRYGGGDNWQLSAARAQAAYYILRRNGLFDEHFLKIEGYADRALKIPKNPNAPQNRRIEIFLLTDGQKSTP